MVVATGGWPTDSTVPVGMPGLCLGSGILVRFVEFGLNPAFAMLFLSSYDLLHRGSLACLVLYAKILAWFLAGAARRLFWLTHGQILLQPGVFDSVPRQIHRLARRPAAPMPGDITSHRQQWHTTRA
jgi:hypothetical protein